MWTEMAQKLKSETKEALVVILAELNHGQRRKLYKNEIVKELLDRYDVEYERLEES